MKTDLKMPEVIIERSGAVHYGIPTYARLSPWFNLMSLDLIGNLTDLEIFRDVEIPFYVSVLPADLNQFATRNKVEKCFIVLGEVPRLIIPRNEGTVLTSEEFYALKSISSAIFSETLIGPA